MEQINFKINLNGNPCGDRWPACRVLINDDVKFDGEIQGKTLVEFDVDVVLKL